MGRLFRIILAAIVALALSGCTSSRVATRNTSQPEQLQPLPNSQVASTNLPAISDAIGKEGKDLPGLVLQTQSSMRELERLIAAMQRHWLLRKYVNKTNPPPLRPLTETAEPERKPMKVFRSPKDSTR